LNVTLFNTDPAEPDVFWFSVGNVQLARLPDVGVPNNGVTNVGLVSRTKLPVPVPVYSASDKW
jgi:hypothetical protein